jgi:hypothetical protein
MRPEINPHTCEPRAPAPSSRPASASAAIPPVSGGCHGRRDCDAQVRGPDSAVAVEDDQESHPAQTVLPRLRRACGRASGLAARGDEIFRRKSHASTAKALSESAMKHHRSDPFASRAALGRSRKLSARWNARAPRLSAFSHESLPGMADDILQRRALPADPFMTDAHGAVPHSSGQRVPKHPDKEKQPMREKRR